MSSMYEPIYNAFYIQVLLPLSYQQVSCVMWSDQSSHAHIFVTLNSASRNDT